MGRSASHHPSHSTSATNHSPARLDHDTQNYPPLQLTSNAENTPPYMAIPVSFTKSDLNQPVACRTLHAPPDESLGRISSLDSGVDTEPEPPTLHLVSAPLSDIVRREVKTTNKLMRMGYPVNEQTVGRTSSPSPPTSRFGAIKSFVQTFKGKA